MSLQALLLHASLDAFCCTCRIIRLPESVSQAQLQQAVADVAADAAVDGVLVQLPLPRHLDEEAVMGALDPRKDVDGFHPLNMG